MRTKLNISKKKEENISIKKEETKINFELETEILQLFFALVQILCNILH